MLQSIGISGIGTPLSRSPAPLTAVTAAPGNTRLTSLTTDGHASTTRANSSKLTTIIARPSCGTAAASASVLTTASTRPSLMAVSQTTGGST